MAGGQVSLLSAKRPLVLLVVLAVFVLDWLTPLGLAVWALYVIPIFLAYELLSKWHPRAVVSVCAFLTLVKFLLSPPAVAFWIVASNRAGGIVFFFVLSHILHTRRFALTAQQESERRFRQLVEGLPQLVWTCEANGSCDYLSPQWIAYTGVPEAPQLGSGWLQQIHPDDRQRVAERWNAEASRGKALDIEFRICRHDGMHRWFRTRALPIRDGQGRVAKWFGTNTDIDDLKQVEQAMQQANAELDERVRKKTTELREINATLGKEIAERKQVEQALRENKRRLDAAFAERDELSRDLHDSVIQSLFAISMSLEECRALFDEDLPTARERLIAETRNLRHVIREVRHVLVEPAFSTINPIDFLSELHSLSQQATDRRLCRIRLDLDAPAAERLTNEQATNLLLIVREGISNAINHGRAASCAIRLKALEDRVQLSIEDDGSGFDPSATHYTGHGLRNMRDRAHLLRADMAVRSRPGSGATVSLTFPLETAYGTP